MSKNATEAVLCAVQPNVFYRPIDIAACSGVSKASLYQSLRELSMGGCLEKIKDGKRTLYLTKQASLF